MSEVFNDLGPAEKAIAKQLRTAIESASGAAEKLSVLLAGIELSGLEAGMLDPKRKESLVAVVTLAQNLSTNLATGELFALLIKVSVDPEVKP